VVEMHVGDHGFEFYAEI